MQIIAKVGKALQGLFGKTTEETAEASGVIVRKRKFTAQSLAQTFVLGFLRNPRASHEELAQMAVEIGVEVTPQAIEQRFTPKLAAFLKELFCKAAKMVIGSDKALAPILERFSSVTIMDSSTIALPDSMQEEYASHEVADRMGPAERCGDARGNRAWPQSRRRDLSARRTPRRRLVADHGPGLF